MLKENILGVYKQVYFLLRHLEANDSWPIRYINSLLLICAGHFLNIALQ